eukprot:CAMPEP_0202866158 /NCGR_PEP_ID=MMETSP1391-20130828/7233_1 /ASSEMBLY_ACC=CAM_ASM_000867 /TAXON_ID=1034604 /ORGANISM="Chlamydomonas leiostraca, Strain SAG 11-49" /LENGTH=237 /DNA_ID=CAMNT_0049546081 /DNA_START=223 /DNA_END=939 /DNA_ORIENTATION=+
MGGPDGSDAAAERAAVALGVEEEDAVRLVTHRYTTAAKLRAASREGLAAAGFYHSSIDVILRLIAHAPPNTALGAAASTEDSAVGMLNPPSSTSSTKIVSRCGSGQCAAGLLCMTDNRVAAVMPVQAGCFLSSMPSYWWRDPPGAVGCEAGQGPPTIDLACVCGIHASDGEGSGATYSAHMGQGCVLAVRMVLRQGCASAPDITQPMSGHGYYQVQNAVAEYDSSCGPVVLFLPALV